ncbi:MAG: Lrp/AsnC family transcriptional regulator [Gammaproteobacteria bacterium]|nr:Lrp/AsnC family transcriptional regulator [Gammaproteobacteria bacterium]
MRLNRLQQALLNDYQRSFPLTSEPFHIIANQLNTDPQVVMHMLDQLKRDGYISRIGPVFRPNTLGASTLAAMSVPASSLQLVADHVSAHPQVNHNYERGHTLNLWFVVNADSVEQRDAVIANIEWETGIPVISLPLVRDYHIDLGFKIDFDDVPPIPKSLHDAKCATKSKNGTTNKSDFISVLQTGLSITDNPYTKLAQQTGLTEDAVIDRIQDMIEKSTIKRFGVVVRHHELGYRANAMCVWDVPDDVVEVLGKGLAQSPHVTLCYQRPRRLPQWRYNLFCMIHGKDRETVHTQINSLIEQHELSELPHAVLFSGRRFKQRGAYYRQYTVSGTTMNAAHG